MNNIENKIDILNNEEMNIKDRIEYINDINAKITVYNHFLTTGTLNSTTSDKKINDLLKIEGHRPPNYWIHPYSRGGLCPSIFNKSFFLYFLFYF